MKSLITPYTIPDAGYVFQYEQKNYIETYLYRGNILNSNFKARQIKEFVFRAEEITQKDEDFPEELNLYPLSLHFDVYRMSQVDLDNNFVPLLQEMHGVAIQECGYHYNAAKAMEALGTPENALGHTHYFIGLINPDSDDNRAFVKDSRGENGLKYKLSLGFEESIWDITYFDSALEAARSTQQTYSLAQAKNPEIYNSPVYVARAYFTKEPVI